MLSLKEDKSEFASMISVEVLKRFGLKNNEL